MSASARCFAGRGCAVGFAGRTNHECVMAVAVVLGTAGVAVAGSTITVGPGGGYEHEAIQPAIDAAVSGDEVVVADGVYTGADNTNLDFGGRLITVRSASGDPAACVIDCEGSGRGFRFHTGEKEAAVVKGLTVRNGSVADLGGAILCDAAGPTIRNCNFTDNTAALFGGGMHNTNGADPTVVDCTFTGNTANATFLIGGGGMSNMNSGPTVTGCVFDANATSLAGGGMANYIANPVVIGCEFDSNESTGDGGGMYNTQSNLTLVNCEFSENDAAHGGGLYTAELGQALLVNCAFVANMAIDGAGVCSDASVPRLVNCTIAGNMATGRGGGIRSVAASDVTVTNCILWDNVDAGGTGEAAQLDCDAGAPSHVAYSCVQDNDPEDASVFPGTGNIDDDPLFMTGGDLRLQPTSPCVDVGDNAAVPADVADLDGDGDLAEPTPFDLDRSPRVRGAGVDLGAFELAPDADGDGVADEIDNCPNDPNPDQNDDDDDAVGDVCDVCPGAVDAYDLDDDSVPNGCDNCPETANGDQADADTDGVGDACDICPGFDDRADADGDRLPDGCDNCPEIRNADQADADDDGVGDACDACPGFDDGLDGDGDGVADGCDVCPGSDDALDVDGDSVPDGCDVCPGSDDMLDVDDDAVPED